jgi:hypothetical protein
MDVNELKVSLNSHKLNQKKLQTLHVRLRAMRVVCKVFQLAEAGKHIEELKKVFFLSLRPKR